MNHYSIRRTKWAAAGIFLFILWLPQANTQPSSTLDFFPTTAPTPAPNYSVSEEAKNYLDDQWDDFWELNFVGNSPYFANRDLYLIVLLQSLMQSTVPVPSEMLRVEPLTEFLQANQLLPPDTDGDDVRSILEDYQQEFGTFLNDRNKHFNRKWVPIVVELRLFFEDIMPTKDTMRLFGDVIDQFLRAYREHAPKSGQKPTEQVLSEWNEYQQRAQIFTTVVPRYYLVLNYLSAMHGGTVALAFHIDSSGQYIRPHRHRATLQRLAIAHHLLPGFEQAELVSPHWALSGSNTPMEPGKVLETDYNYQDSSVGPSPDSTATLVLYALLGLIILLVIAAVIITSVIVALHRKRSSSSNI